MRLSPLRSYHRTSAVNPARLSADSLKPGRLSSSAVPKRRWHRACQLSGIEVSRG
jgi:hypothetical protein